MALTTIADLSTRPLLYAVSYQESNVNLFGFGSWYPLTNIAASGWRDTSAPGTTGRVCSSSISNFEFFRHFGTGSDQLYLIRSQLNNSLTSRHGFWLVDRLADASGLSGTVTTEQSFASAPTVTGSSNNMAIRRGASDYSDVCWFLEVWSDVGTTSTTFSIKYTNGAGTPNQTFTPTNRLGGADSTDDSIGRRAGRVIALTPADYIQSIQSVTLDNSTGTTGDFGVMACRFLTHIGSTGFTLDAVGYDEWGRVLCPIPEDACLTALVDGTAAFSNNVNAHLFFVRK